MFRTIEEAQSVGYNITLLYFWLDSVDLAKERVRARVREGGHNIPEKVIERRYYAGIRNLFDLYMDVCDYWMLFNNSRTKSDLIAEGYPNELKIKNNVIFAEIKRQKEWRLKNQTK